MQQTQKKILRSTVYQLVVLIFLHYSFDEHFHMELLKIISYSSSMFQFLKRFFNQIENKIFFFVRDSNPEILPKANISSSVLPNFVRLWSVCVLQLKKMNATIHYAIQYTLYTIVNNFLIISLMLNCFILTFFAKDKSPIF